MTTRTVKSFRPSLDLLPSRELPSAGLGVAMEPAAPHAGGVSASAAVYRYYVDVFNATGRNLAPRTVNWELVSNHGRPIERGTIHGTFEAGSTRQLVGGPSHSALGDTFTIKVKLGREHVFTGIQGASSNTGSPPFIVPTYNLSL
jgi:hypothetical protein